MAEDMAKRHSIDFIRSLARNSNTQFVIRRFKRQTNKQTPTNFICRRPPCATTIAGHRSKKKNCWWNEEKRTFEVTSLYDTDFFNIINLMMLLYGLLYRRFLTSQPLSTTTTTTAIIFNAYLVFPMSSVFVSFDHFTKIRCVCVQRTGKGTEICHRHSVIVI